MARKFSMPFTRSVTATYNSQNLSGLRKELQNSTFLMGSHFVSSCTLWGRDRFAPVTELGQALNLRKKWTGIDASGISLAYTLTFSERAAASD